MMKVVVILVSMFFIPLALSSALDQCSNCGNMEVPYPLSTSDNCGVSNYRVSCNNGSLEFLSERNSYYKILSIDADASRFIISPPKIERKKCYSSDLLVKGLKINESSPFSISKRNTVMLFNCSNIVLYSPLNCSSNSLCRQYEEKIKEGRGCRNTLCCTYLKDSSITSHFIRLRVGGCTAYTSVVDLKAGDPPTSWNYGIELQWVPPNFC
ncbi:wall-associated receptor kinase-like 20 [Macadamia integrifolia]|uniref:wall-associated receptor kinase-like 20 n=1 Tax=Macadamia integrifolia TaxID=60698 RepID=UPI001C4FCFAB|nr:wall-associated receptor kinase-like 20 [Macadamia integrifolia]